MTVLAQDTNRKVTIVAGSLGSRSPLIASEVCFVGSLLSRDPTGFIHRLVAGEPFAGIAMERIESKQWKSSGAANGDLFVNHASGRGWLIASLTVTQADAIKRRKVYASDDNTFSLTAAAGNTFIGEVVEILSTSLCVVEFHTDETLDDAVGIRGVETLPDAPTTLTVKQANKILLAPVSAARTYTLPPAADWIGKTFTIVNDGGAFAVTIQANAAENIGPANTLVQAATLGRSTVLMSTNKAASHEIAILSNQ